MYDSVSKSNFVYTLMSFYSDEVLMRKTIPSPCPNPIVFAALMAGVVEEDRVVKQKQDAYIQSIVDSGVDAFVTNTGGGSGGDENNWNPIAPDGMNYMQVLFFANLIKKNATVGNALLAAKKQYFDENRVEHSGYDEVAITGLALYGDPAFNPYEPCNEGKSL